MVDSACSSGHPCPSTRTRTGQNRTHRDHFPGTRSFVLAGCWGDVATCSFLYPSAGAKHSPSAASILRGCALRHPRNVKWPSQGEGHASPVWSSQVDRAGMDPVCCQYCMQSRKHPRFSNTPSTIPPHGYASNGIRTGAARGPPGHGEPCRDVRQPVCRARTHGAPYFWLVIIAMRSTRAMSHILAW